MPRRLLQKSPIFFLSKKNKFPGVHSCYLGHQDGNEIYHCVQSNCCLVGACHDPGLLADARVISTPKTKKHLVVCRLGGGKDAQLLSGIK